MLMGIVDTIYYNYCKPSLNKLISERIPEGESIMKLEREIKERAMIDNKVAAQLQTLFPNLIEKFADYRGERAIAKFKDAISTNIYNLFAPFVAAIIKSKLADLYLNDLKTISAHLKAILLQGSSLKKPTLSKYPLKKPKVCNSHNPQNEILEYMCAPEGLKCMVKCVDCKNSHDILYTTIKDPLNDAQKRLNEMSLLYCLPCAKCGKCEKQWNVKIILHKAFTKECVLCKPCALYMLRVQCNGMGINNKAFVYECNCHCKIEETFVLSSLLGNELSHHFAAMSAENHDKMVCVNCADVVVINASNIEPGKIKCAKCLASS